MKIVLVSKCSLHIEQYVEFKMSVLISPSKSLISSRWVTYIDRRTDVKREERRTDRQKDRQKKTKQNNRQTDRPETIPSSFQC